MKPVDLPLPVVRRPQVRTDEEALERDLRARVDGEVRFDAGTRAAYSTDGSNYRQVPIGVVVPRTVEAATEAVAVCREHDVPLLSRGGGTSLAGECCNTAVVMDWSKYCNRLLSVDPANRRCVVEPGIVLDDLNRQLAEHGLQYGPRPATHPNCTIGGMIGNNSCGSTAQAYGKVVDNLRRLEVLTYDGARMWVGATDDAELERLTAGAGREAELYRGLVALRDRYAGLVRERYPDIPRRVSGYNLDSLLPEHGFDVAGLLTGSESTLVTVLRAELELVPVPKHTSLVVLGYEDICQAADHVPAVLEHEPAALEGVDHQLIHFQRVKHLNSAALRELPDGRAYLMVQLVGDTREEVDARARALIDAKPDDVDHTWYDDEQHVRELWQIRESGLGATAHVPGKPDTWEGWEDSAVPVDRLGDYLRDLKRLYEEFGYGHPSVYGHFGHGCVHTRIPFDLESEEGVARMRAFVEKAADLVVSYGGSLSGEHGDGQSRGELLVRMFGPDVIEGFERLKGLFDPGNRMNPGKVVLPYRLDENLRLGADYLPWEPETVFSFPQDDGRFSRAAARCVGVGKCRSSEGGVMCPSYRATREEEHSTRGRARLLFEMVRNGDDSPVTDGWRSDAVHDALDLCLACKGCKTDCPVNVDMATYKAEFLHHHYRGRLRPLAHYSMGWLPAVARAVALAPRTVNALSSVPWVARAAKALGGVAPERSVPVFAEQRFTDWWRQRGGPRGDGHRGEVVVWPDTFTDHFHPAIGKAAVEVLEAAGFRVKVPDAAVCCGLTWISTGQLTVARRVLGHTLDVLRADLRRGTPVVGLEPSCTAVFRADAAELLPKDPDVGRLREQTRTLAELLVERAGDWRPPPVDARAVVQRHCHQYAVMGFDADRKLLERAGVDADVLDAGCCGLAGNFGFEKGHYDVSMACAEAALLPAVREADAATLVLADGFSCRTQVDQSDAGRTPLHLAEVLAAGLKGQEAVPERPAAPGARALLPLGAATATMLAVLVGAWRLRRSRH
ncbi:FAD/FMN-containing dehydrogenase/NAD-dependent dihydropyrimidine dehydrogenase PreA subunit [Streptomyces aurantiacus]|uniref:FAD-binding and (Fe-S)-binding domain-containing protein n=1 Tax=Streptomyces aurantiacus TaxID=47760 RepID=UPI002790134D|nr:FAD-binding and (Fe-S)-binding domain-containing protein [Streptomyces aurantiacus]MDQ0772791.1 FAD/FMN-containing dehydrogenase/NAD-dependent dihydropyrimidine dehydrogenase PreA subunit [Streptomyces aurantiacus]